MKAIIGQKQEMTQVFGKDNQLIPVTIIDISGNVLLDNRTNDKDGYEAVVLGKGKKKNSNKAEQGKYKELGYVPEYITEVRSAEAFVATEGETVSDISGKIAVVTGITKGKGFQGVMTRWGFKGTKQTHGQSDRMRAPGSIGSGTTPGRVYKGKKMAGRVGGTVVTTPNLEVVKHLVEENILLIKGAVPGSRGSHVIIKFNA